MTGDVQHAYDRIATLRNRRWGQQDDHAEGTPEWWFYQGATEALAEAMSILEHHGAQVIIVRR